MSRKAVGHDFAPAYHGSLQPDYRGLDVMGDSQHPDNRGLNVTGYSRIIQITGALMSRDSRHPADKGLDVTGGSQHPDMSFQSKVSHPSQQVGGGWPKLTSAIARLQLCEI